MGAVPAPESPTDPIALKITDGIAHLTLQRPPLNILDLATLGRLNAALRECDAGAARVLLISSSLPRAFSAGVEIRDHVPAQLGPMLAEVRENARLLLGLKAVTIGAIRGSTLGGGAELALLWPHLASLQTREERLHSRRGNGTDSLSRSTTSPAATE